MDKKTFSIPAVILGISLIIVAIIVCYTLFGIKSANNIISVTGSTQKQITSDIAKWRSSFTRNIEASNINTGYTQMKTDLDAILSYLYEKGVTEGEITIDPIVIIPFSDNDSGKYYYGAGKPTGYTLTQNITIASNDINKITNVAQNSGILINQGIIFSSQPVEYYYSKLAELRVEMLGEATNDAKLRAQKIAEQAGTEIGDLKSASMGVFQITAPYSTEISDYGMYDTSTIDKQITAIVKASFEIK